MRLLLQISIFIGFLLMLSCSGETKPRTPLDTFKTYTKAIKQNDTTTMKLLLSSETIKMHEQEAKAQNTTVDEIVEQETLFSPDQRTVELRNEKIDGDRGSLEVKNSFGTWVTVPFVLEDGEWKIDKKGFADQMIMDMDEENRKLDALVNQGKDPGAPDAIPDDGIPASPPAASSNANIHGETAPQ